MSNLSVSLSRNMTVELEFKFFLSMREVANKFRIVSFSVFFSSHLVLQRLAMVFNFGNQSAFSDDDHKGIWKISTTLWEYQHHIVFKNWTEAYRREFSEKLSEKIICCTLKAFINSIFKCGLPGC